MSFGRAARGSGSFGAAGSRSVLGGGPSRGSSGHLGDLVTALVDGQLDPSSYDLATSHLMWCSDCRCEVEQERQLKSRLRAMGEPGLPASLFGRLSALDFPDSSGLPESDTATGALVSANLLSGNLGSAELVPGRLSSELVSTEVRAAQPTSLAVPPFSRAAPLRDARRGRLLAGAASFLLVGVGVAVASSADAQPAPSVQPSSNALTTGQQVAGQNPGSASVPGVAAANRRPVKFNDSSFRAMTASYTQ